MTDEKAPVCPVTKSEVREPNDFKGRTTVPIIPPATDLPSLIRTVNKTLDVLRTLTNTYTINNTYNLIQPLPGKTPPTIYPNWQEQTQQPKTGYVFYKAKGKDPDQEQRAYIQRTDKVDFADVNEGTSDKSNHLIWSYPKPLDSPFGDSGGIPPFQEDFFERVTNVHWGGKKFVAVGSSEVIVFNSKGNVLMRTSLVGGAGDYYDVSCVIDSKGCPYVLKAAFSGLDTVTKISADGKSIEWTTTVADAGDSGHYCSIAIDADDRIYTRTSINSTEGHSIVTRINSKGAMIGSSRQDDYNGYPAIGATPEGAFVWPQTANGGAFGVEVQAMYGGNIVPPDLPLYPGVGDWDGRYIQFGIQGMSGGPGEFFYVGVYYLSADGEIPRVTYLHKLAASGASVASARVFEAHEDEVFHPNMAFYGVLGTDADKDGNCYVRYAGTRDYDIALMMDGSAKTWEHHTGLDDYSGVATGYGGEHTLAADDDGVITVAKGAVHKLSKDGGSIMWSIPLAGCLAVNRQQYKPDK